MTRSRDIGVGVAGREAKEIILISTEHLVKAYPMPGTTDWKKITGHQSHAEDWVICLIDNEAPSKLSEQIPICRRTEHTEDSRYTPVGLN